MKNLHRSKKLHRSRLVKFVSLVTFASFASSSLMLLTLSLVACGRPPATPTTAEATSTLAICWDDNETTAGDDPVRLSLRRALATRLNAAGYRLASGSKCDLGMHWNYKTHTYRGDTSFSHIHVVFRSKKKMVLDTVTLEISSVPLEEPDRVAIPVVNAMNASPKLATYAHERAETKAKRKSNQPDDADETDQPSAPPPAPSPAASSQ